MEFRGRLSSKESIEAFMFAGKATLTLQSAKTGVHFTYQVAASKDEATGKKAENPVFFVSVLNGPDNWTNYKYMGIVSKPGAEFKTTKGTKIGPDAPSMKAWNWFYAALLKGTVPETVEVWHEDKCGRCGRKLTVPESIEHGFGPECFGKL